MNTKIIVGGIVLVLATYLITSQFTAPKKRTIAVSIANLAQLAILQGDSCISPGEMLKMRSADAVLSANAYQHKTLSLGVCCPCPLEIMNTVLCQCDSTENSRQYAAMMSWRPQLSLVGVSTEAEKIPSFKEVKDGELVLYQMPALKPGPYLFRINAAFDNKNSKIYDVKVNVNKSGNLTW